MGTPRPAGPAPAGLSGLWESPGTTFSHGGCSSSGFPPAHEPPNLPESIRPLPQPPALASLPVFCFPRAGPCSGACILPRLGFFTSGIRASPLPLCRCRWVAAETLVTGPQWGHLQESQSSWGWSWFIPLAAG